LQKLLKYSSREPLKVLNALIFRMEHPDPLDQEIQLCSNEVPGVTNDNALRGPIFI